MKRLALFSPFAARSVLILFLISSYGSSTSALATSRVVHRFDGTKGLTVPTVFSLAQDTDGFIWIGTAAGLVRFDGVEMRRWAKEIISRDVGVLVASASGEMLVAETAGMLYRVTSEGVETLPGLDGQPFQAVRAAMFDGAQGLWVLSTDGVLCFRDESKAWHVFDSKAAFPGEQVRHVRPASGNRVYVLTDKAVWRTRMGHAPEKILDVLRAIDVVEHPDGSIFVLAWWTKGELIQLSPTGQSRIRASLDARAIDLTVRGNTIWASFDRFLVSLRGEDPPDIIGPDQDLPSGGPLLVDHEGSLWLGTFNGLLQYPEPESKIWTHKDGLPLSHPRHLALAPDGVWISTWGWIGFIGRDGRARAEPGINARIPCIDSRGFVWAYSNDRGLVTNEHGAFAGRESPKAGGLQMCARGERGTLWIGTPNGLLRAHEETLHIATFPLPPADDGTSVAVNAVLEDREHRIWAGTTDGRICRSSVDAIAPGKTVAWACQLIATYTSILALIQMPSGEIWAATNRAGLWRFRSGRWEPLPASQRLASQALFSLRESRTGGVWLLGHGVTIRVIERTDLAEGWQELERLSAWHGLQGAGAADLVEAADGALWLTTAQGVIRVPKEARDMENSPPRVRLVNMRINGQAASSTGEAPRLPAGSEVELHFAALSYRDRSRLQFQYRLSANAPWTDWRDNSGVLRFANLGSGSYQVQMRASLDGKDWSFVPAPFSFEVLKPWYLQTSALVLLTVIVATIVYTIYRARLAVLLRLERQRAQIARDLHDEMGSGLGSIGILSGLAAENDLDGLEHRELAKKISETAGELGTTLTEIVWALKPGTPSLEALAYHLAERGGRLFPGGDVVFKTQFPAVWPMVELSLAVRRNILLIVSEAMHNAARHSYARQIVLGLEPTGSRRWRLWLDDDGCGLSNGKSGSNGSGMGLENMKRRATEIGAQLSLEPNNGKGTSLLLIFDPKADDLDVKLKLPT